jgi:amidophosphoribosyltransferase
VIGHSVYQLRKELGRILARENPVPADMIVPVLDSGNAAALGYAEESGIPYETALIRNQYVKRTFIEPSASIRDFRVRIKHNAPKNLVGGKRVVLVEDSIVRGTTLLKLVGLIRQAGATEVHVRVSSPPNIGPCHYGIDTPTREELIAHRHSVEEIRQILGADTLGYLSLEGLRQASKHLKHGICDACFSDDYPIPVDAESEPPQLSLFRPVETDDDPSAGG